MALLGREKLFNAFSSANPFMTLLARSMLLRTLMKVLVIEPYIYMRRTLTLLLRDMGHEVFTIERCDDAVPFLDGLWPDLIFSNYFLGDRNAVQLCSEVRELFGELPNVLIHSSVPEHRVCALQFPEISFLRAPFLPDELQRELRKVIHLINPRTQISLTG
jgi:DNA-binding response OmpR family regulator